MRGHLADVINHAKFYLNQIRGFDSVGVKFFSFPQEREVAINTWLEQRAIQPVIFSHMAI